MTEQEEIEKCTNEIARKTLLYFCEVSKKNIPPSWYKKSDDNADNKSINFTLYALSKIILEILMGLEENYKLSHADIEEMLNKMVIAILHQLNYP